MSNKYLLDSSAWIEYFAGTETGKKIREMVEKEDLATCILSIAEISDKFSREKEKFDMSLAFIRSVSAIANITVASCAESGKLKADRRKIKKGFSLADAIIYLTAKENSCILITKDEDFEGMEGAMIIR